MEEKSVVTKLNDLDRELFGDEGRNFLALDRAPFDISRPNFHESKTEFLREHDAVQTVLRSCDAAINALYDPETRDDPVHKEMLGRLRKAINGHAGEMISRKPLEVASDLARKNLVETGFFINSVIVLLDMKSCYEQRLKDLDDQEKRYWNVSHRPPNYYARTIALRFARHFARKKGVKPTFGTSRDGGHPSTDYGRALERVFKILEITASVRNAANWAIGELTEEDWNPPGNSLLGGLMAFQGDDYPVKPKGRNVLAELSYMLAKGR